MNLLENLVRFLLVIVFISVSPEEVTASTTAPTETEVTRYTLTPEQRQQVEANWETALKKHLNTLVTEFERFMPDDHRAFNAYKASEWLQPYSDDRNKVDGLFELIADRNTNPDNARIRELRKGFSELYFLSLDMQFYLTDKNRDRLQKARDRIAFLVELLYEGKS